MNVEDPYFIPSVPRYRANMDEDFNDTIGDDFFFKAENMVASPLAAITNHEKESQQRGRRSFMKPNRPADCSEKEVKTNGPAEGRSPMKPPQRGGRRSLIKPGRPSVGAPITRAQTTQAAAATVCPTAKAPATTTSRVVQRPRPADCSEKEVKTNGPAEGRSPMKPPQREGRRSLIKPGRPSVGAPITRSQTTQAAAATVCPTAKAPATTTSRVVQRPRPADCSEKEVKTNGPAEGRSPMKPPQSGGRRSLIKPDRPSVGAPTTRSQTTQAAAATVCPTAKAPATTTSRVVQRPRRSFMDPTISYSSKHIGTPSKKG